MVIEKGIKVRKKDVLYRLFIINSGEVRTNKGIVTYKTDPLRIIILKGYTEDIQFNITTIGTYAVVLGIP